MPSTREIRLILLVVIGHVLLTHWSLALVPSTATVPLIWLPGGFLLGCLVLMPMRLWPWVIALVGFGVVAGQLPLIDRSLDSVLASLAADLIQGIAGAWLFRRFCGGRDGLTEYRHLAVFLLLGVLTLPAVTAPIGVAAVGAFAPAESFWSTFALWYVSVALGILLVTPLIVEIGKGVRDGFWVKAWQRRLHLALLVGVLAAAGLLTLLGQPSPFYEHLLIVLSLPMLILAALSAGLWGAISVASVLAVASLHIWVLGHLPTAEAGLEGHTAVDLQVHLFAVMISSLFIGLAVEKLRRSREAMSESSLRYQAIFDHSPIALLEEDFSAVKAYLDSQPRSGECDLDAWFDANPDALRTCSQLVRIVSVNSGAGEIFDAGSHSELLSNLDRLFDDASLTVFREEIIAFCRGAREFEAEAEQLTLTGDTIFTTVRAALLPGHEADWRRVIVVIEDITKRKKAQRQLEDTFNQLKLAVDSAQLGVWRLDLTNTRLDWNDQQLAIYGLRAEQFDHSIEAWRSRVLPDDLASADAGFWRVQGGGSIKDVEFRIRRPDGEIRYISASGTAITAEDGQLTELIGINADVTEERRKEERLRQAATVFSSTAEGVTITELDGTIIDVNEAFTEITGYAADEVIGQTPSLLQSGRHDADFYRAMWRALEETGQWRGEIWNRRKDGSLYPQLLTVSAVREQDGEPTGYVGVFTDITRIKRSEERLDHLAHHDPLTDLPNRLLLMERLGQSIRHAARHQSMLAVVFVDLDRFKTVNDSLSHTAGDQLLQQVARRFVELVRADDTVARLSGDEFILLLEGAGNADQVTTAITKLMSAFDAPFELEVGEVRITASMGVALYPQDGTDAATLLRNADAAMYRAKDEGRDSYHFYTKELTTSAFEHLFLENALRYALQREEFQLAYQPQIDLQTGKCVAVEVLLRWEHPEQGTISPDRFIPIAEQSGLIRGIGQWVLQTACAQGKAWLDQGLPFEHLAVNVAGPQVQDPAFADQVQSVLEATGLPARRLELEVTEGFVMHRAPGSIRQLQQIRAKGIEIAIDDFGTGYSSLSYLKQLPIDTLKIDQSFVREIPHDTNDMAISAAVVAMAGELGLKTVAEGVETIAQAHFFRDHGCRLAQGYFFSEPLSADQLAAFFAETLEA